MPVQTYIATGLFVHACPIASGIFGTLLENSSWNISFANRYITGSSSYTGFISYIDSLEHIKSDSMFNLESQRTGDNACKYIVSVIFTGYCNQKSENAVVPDSPPPPPPPPPPPTIYSSGLAPWTGIYRGFSDGVSDYAWGSDGRVDHVVLLMWQNFPYTLRIEQVEMYPLTYYTPKLPALHPTYKNGTHPSDIYFLGSLITTGTNDYNSPFNTYTRVQNQFVTGWWSSGIQSVLSGELFLSFYANRKDINITTGFYLRINYNNNTGWSGVISNTVDRSYFLSLT